MLARLTLALGAALLLAACSSTESPPPRSPVADTPTPPGAAAPTATAQAPAPATPATVAPAAPPTPTESPTAVATATPTSPAGEQTPTGEQPLELVTGNAIEQFGMNPTMIAGGVFSLIALPLLFFVRQRVRIPTEEVVVPV